jgi:hypothetical protein
MYSDLYIRGYAFGHSNVSERVYVFKHHPASVRVRVSVLIHLFVLVYAQVSRHSHFCKGIRKFRIFLGFCDDMCKCSYMT